MTTDGDTTSPEKTRSLFQAVAAAVSEIGDTFAGLIKAPRALWGINISYLLEGLAYFGVLTILGKYMSEDVSLTDLHAGWVYSLFTGGITLAMLILGGVSDKIGVRRALLISLGLMVVGRLSLAFSGTFFEYGQGASSGMFWAVLAGLFMVVIGYGMYQPAAYAGVKAYTNKKTAAIGFAMIYALMNLGAFFSGLVSPPVRQEYQMVGVYWVYVAITILAFLSVFIILTRRTVKLAVQRVKEEDDTFSKEDGENGQTKEETSAVQTSKQDKPKPSLLEPATILFSVSFAACSIALIYKMISAPVNPLVESAQTVRAFSEVWRNVMDSAMPSAEPRVLQDWFGDKSQILASIAAADADQSTWIENGLGFARSAIPTLRSSFRKPHDRVDEKVTLDIDELALAVMQAKVKWDAAYLFTGVGHPQVRSMRILPIEWAVKTREILRAHAVRTMAAAYGLIAPVDDEVVENLRLRLKRVEEEIIPIDSDTRVSIIRQASKKQRAMLLQQADQAMQLARWIEERVPGPTLVAVIAKLKTEAEFARQLAAAWDQNPSEVALEVLSNKLLFDALCHRDMADHLVNFGDGEMEPKAISAAMLARFKFASDVDFFNNVKEVLPDAARLSTEARFEGLMLRYGVLLAPALLALILLVWRLLRLRPDHPFHNGRFTFFIFILIPVQTLFAHNWLTLPYYINRAFGGSAVGANFEFFSNINPILIFFLTPLVAALTSRARVYPMMIWGTLVMAAPTFLLTLPPSPALLITYILLMSIGEAMWQPRFLQLVAEIAPEGQVGVYMGIGQLPWFMTKVFTGVYSGWFLSQYCPLVGPQNTEFMWLIYALIAMVSPVALWMAKGRIGSKIEQKHT